MDPGTREGTPSRWKIILAFAAIYSSWGTTYLAIRMGVEDFPPALFSGARLSLAGLLVLGFLALRGQPLRLRLREYLWMLGVAVLLFVCGNGLLTWAETYVSSGVASVIVATIPLWIALLELFWPHGERLTPVGWIGLLLGLIGVLILLAPGLESPTALWQEKGPLLVLCSAICWALGSLVVRHRRVHVDHLLAAGYQMVFGGLVLVVIGLLLQEHREISAASFRTRGVVAFFYLLIVGSLIGYIAYNWLLRHVSAAMVGTYAYVNPIVAILVGWLFHDGEITLPLLAGMGVILGGVALVRGVGMRKHAPIASRNGATKEAAFDWNQGDDGAGVLLPQED